MVFLAIKLESYMFNFKKLFLLIAATLSISFNGFAITEPTHKESVKAHISNFDLARDSELVIEITNKNFPWVGGRSEPYFKDPSCHIKVLHENEKLAGFIIYSNTRPMRGRINKLAVADNFRNKGYGQRLISTALEDFHNMGVEHVTLGCYHDNTSALNLYKKIGFKIIHEGGLCELEYKIPVTSRMRKIQLALISI